MPYPVIADTGSEYPVSLSEEIDSHPRRVSRQSSDADVIVDLEDGSHEVNRKLGHEGISDEELLNQMLVRYTGGSDVLKVLEPDE